MHGPYSVAPSLFYCCYVRYACNTGNGETILDGTALFSDCCSLTIEFLMWLSLKEQEVDAVLLSSANYTECSSRKPSSRKAPGSQGK